MVDPLSASRYTKCLVDYGGAIKTADATYSSYAHRDALFVIQFYGSAQNGGAFPADGIDVINGMVTSLSPNPSAACGFFSLIYCCHRSLNLLSFVDPNYIDPTLTATEWQSQYFGQNINRLMQIKAAYDPNQVFKFPQSIPLPGNSNAVENNLTSNGNSHGTGSTRAVQTSTVGGSIILSLVLIAATYFF